jgi:hypothetical protein
VKQNNKQQQQNIITKIKHFNCEVFISPDMHILLVFLNFFIVPCTIEGSASGMAEGDENERGVADCPSSRLLITSTFGALCALFYIFHYVISIVFFLYAAIVPATGTHIDLVRSGRVRKTVPM